jgi:cation transport ATPase
VLLHQGALLLLFRVSHLLEDRLTENAAVCDIPSNNKRKPAFPLSQGALLLLLFRVSHLLEDRLTERAAGSLQRLFDSVPDTASVVEVDEAGSPRVATTQQVGL